MTKTNPNQLKMTPAVHSKEDMLYRYKNKRNDTQYTLSGLKRVMEFRVNPHPNLEMAFI